MTRLLMIGAGVATTSLLKHLLDSDNIERLEIDIVDNRDNFGRGQAYIEDSDILLANVPILEMSLNDDPDHFKQWLDKNGYETNRFSSRRQFGEYMNEMLGDIVETNQNITSFHEKVTDLDYDGTKYTATINGEEKHYHAVFLGIGMLEYIDPYQLKGTPQFIYNPYPIEETLNDVTGNVAVIGSGLSGIDCLRYLLIDKKLNKVYMFNRSNEMPAVRGDSHSFQFKYFTSDALTQHIKDGKLPISDVKTLFLKEADYQEINLKLFERKSGDVRNDLSFDINHPEEIGQLEYFLIEFNRVFTPYLHYLTKSDQKILMEKYQPYISENYSPMPMSVAKQIVEWFDENRLEMIEDLDEIVKEEAFKLTADDMDYHMEWVINATGPNNQVDMTTDPLIKHLHDKKIIQPHHLGGIVVNDRHKIISPKFGTLNTCFAFGELTFGMTYLSNAVFDIYEMSRSIADDILKTIKEK